MRKITLPIFTAGIIFITSFVFNSTQDFYKSFVTGQRYFQEEKFQQALPLFALAFKLNPRDSRNAKYLLLTYDKLGRKEQARDTLLFLLKENPDNLDFTELLADYYYGLKDYSGAEKIYLEILDKRPNFNTEKKLAEVWLWQKKYNEAITTLEDLIKTNPRDKELMLLLADAYSWSRQYEASIKLYKKLLGLGLDSKAIMFKLADALRFSGRDEEAIKLYEKFLEEK